MRSFIEVKVIPHKDHRYPKTCGDWQFDGALLTVRVSDLGNWRMEYLIADHEVREALLCRSRGITEKQVDDFDITFKGAGEPGDDPRAPYYREHFFATSIERLTAAELGIDWIQYEAKIEGLDG